MELPIKFHLPNKSITVLLPTRSTLSLLMILAAIMVFLGAATPVQAGNKVRKVKVKNVDGEAVGAESQSIEDIRQKALGEAKLAALRKAGVEEEITAFQDYFSGESSGRFEELFTSDILSQLRGAVSKVEIRDEKKWFGEDGLVHIKIWIDCTVVKYSTRADRSFQLEVKGFKKFYRHEDELRFSVTPSKAAHLKVFVLTQSASYLLFPNEYEASGSLAAGTSSSFPTKDLTYLLETQQEEELHRAILVLLKEDIPYTDPVDGEHILRWIVSIPPDQRVLETFTFSVVKD